MNSEKDTYKTIARPSIEVLFKEKGSKFYGFAFPVLSEEEVKEKLDQLKKVHHSARHWCYAWQLGMHYEHYRANDDGEPSNSAGMPIYGQLQAFHVTNVLVVVVRYFGGTKLGVGGLIQAYKTTARMALESSKILKRTIDLSFELRFPYSELNTVMRILKSENLRITDQYQQMDCRFIIEVRKKDADRIFQLFENTFNVIIKPN